MNYLEFSLYNTMFSENRFICSIPIWMPFFFLANCPGYNLHYNVEYKWWKEMLWFIFYLIEKAFSLSPLGTMLVVSIGRCPLSGWSFILFLACWVLFFFFLSWCVVGCCQMLFLCLWNDHLLFAYYSANMVYSINWTF